MLYMYLNGFTVLKARSQIEVTKFNETTMRGWKCCFHISGMAELILKIKHMFKRLQKFRLPNIAYLLYVYSRLIVLFSFCAIIKKLSLTV